MRKFLLLSAKLLFGHKFGNFGNFNVNLRALSLLTVNIHFELIAVEQAQTFMHVGDSNSPAIDFRKAVRRNAHAVVFNFDIETSIAPPRAQVNMTAFDARSQSVLDGVFHHGLKQHAGNEGVQRAVVNIFEYLKLIRAEARHFNIQIIVDKFQFVAERNKRFVLANQPPKNVGELDYHASCRVRIKTNQRGNSVQRIEKEMGIDLAGESSHARLE